MKDSFQKKTKMQGFSLMECLVTLALMMMLTSWWLAGYMQITQRFQTFLAMKQLMRSLNAARSLAIQSDQNTYFCLTGDGKTCSKGSAKSYMVWQEDEALHAHVAENITVKAPILINWQGFTLDDKLTFTPNGFCEQNGRFSFQEEPSKPILACTIMVSQTGRIRKQCDEINTLL